MYFAILKLAGANIVNLTSTEMKCAQVWTHCRCQYHRVLSLESTNIFAP